MGPKKVRDRKRQTKLNFSPASASSSKATSKMPFTATPTKDAKSTLSASIKSRGRINRENVACSSSEDELARNTDEDRRVSMPGTSARHGMFTSSDVDLPTSDSSSEEERVEVIKPKATSRKRRRVQESSDTDHDPEKITVTKTQRHQRRQLQAEKSSSDNELRMPSSKQQKTGGRALSPVDDEDSDEVISTPRPKRRRITKRHTSPDSDDNDNGVADEDCEEDREGSEQDDLKEDLAFLRSSPLPDRGKLRSTQAKPMNKRQKALEALKKRRAGTNEPSSSATPNRSRRVVLESASESELEIIKEETGSDADAVAVTEDEEEEQDDEDESEREANALDMFLEDNDDEAFIDDDVEGQLGEPVLGVEEYMPLIVARMSMAKAKDLFKYAIEWMVMKKIHPAFDSTSEVYDITFRKLEDEVKGLANSKFSSSSWTPDFTRAIRARPDLLMNEITKGMRDVMNPHCEACNRKNHPASQELMLTGQPYDSQTLEPLAEESDSDSNGSDSDASSLSADSEAELDGEKPTYNAQGERLPPESKRFTLGSTCAANAQVAHTLHHWRYQLYSWVKDYLAREGHLTAEKLVRRDRWSDKKRDKAARKIVKKMEEKGEIRKLYRLYKEQVEFAFEAANEQKDGWGRRR